MNKLPHVPERVATILGERAATHGNYRDNSQISQSFKRLMESTDGWRRLNDMQRECLHMNAHKIGRILAGDPNFPDHWDDIAGYCELVVKWLTPTNQTTHTQPAHDPLQGTL